MSENDGAQYILEMRGVSKRYESGGAGEGPEVLRGLNLTVEAGESLAVVGPSGCGKSTLLNLAGALDRPTSGTVLLGGQDLSALDERALAAVRNRRVGFVFQLHHLLPQCTIWENVLVPTLAGHGGDAGQAEARARRLLERVGLGQRLSYPPSRLSGGERQRAAVVRALINQPKLLLADEPTGSLDRASADNLVRLLVELNREEHVTLLVVTHAMHLAERMGRVLELRDGTLTRLQQTRTNGPTP